MEKEEFLTEDNITFLSHAVKSLEEAERKLEESFNKKDPISFNKAKSFMLELNKEISETLK